MHFSLEIDSNNEGMMTQEDVATALWALAQKLMINIDSAKSIDMGSVTDQNGKSVGIWLIKK
jgi:hypothetical protein